MEKKINNAIISYKKNYKFNKFKAFLNLITGHIDFYIYKSMIYSQKYKYYKELSKSKKNIIHLLLSIYYGKKYFYYSKKCNCELYSFLGKNTKIYHGGIVINSNAIIGDNVKFHGNNCVGNNGLNEKAPIIGNNVDIGFGAVIIGDIRLANNIIVGANSVVTKSFDEENVVIAGNPAKIIKKYNKN